MVIAAQPALIFLYYFMPTSCDYLEMYFKLNLERTNTLYLLKNN